MDTTEIRERVTDGRTIRRIDVKDLLTEIDRLTSALAQSEHIRQEMDKNFVPIADYLAVKEALAAKEDELKQAVEDIKCRDHCDVCKFSNEGSEDCDTYDFDCQKCQSRKCVCRTCRDESKWQWRGYAAYAHPPKEDEV